MQSLCLISDHQKHDMVDAYAFHNKVIAYVKTICACVARIPYFSGGAASQYKNSKTLQTYLTYLNISEFSKWVSSHTEFLKERLSHAQTVSGTWDNHCFVPISGCNLGVSTLSGDNSPFTRLDQCQRWLNMYSKSNWRTGRRFRTGARTC